MSEYNTGAWCRNCGGDNFQCADCATPPTPDPRERGDAIDYGHLAHCNASRSAPIGPNRSCVCWNLMQDGIAYRATHPAPAPSEAVAWQLVHTRTGQRWTPATDRASVENQQREFAALGATETRIAALVDTLPAPARGVTEAEAKVVRILRDELGKPHLPDDLLLRQFSEEARWIRLTLAALTPDAEGGA